jgi:ABC-type multidrug transport system ATPase subunit
VLQVEGLSFSYPGRHVFLHWSMDFAPGLTWIRGSNGSGKSTLLKLLAGALPPLTGRLRVRGIDEALRPLDYRREVFWCGPAAIPFDHLRPTEYFGFLRTLYPRFDAGAIGAHVEGLGLKPFLHKRLGELSTGTQRKVWLAAALVAGSAVVLLDEPLSALDSSSMRYTLDQIELAAAETERSWIVASHESLGNAGDRAVVVSLDASGM